MTESARTIARLRPVKNPGPYPNRVMHMRVQSGMTFDELVARSGVGNNKLSDISHGRRPLLDDHAERIAKALNVDKQDLYAADSLAAIKPAKPKPPRPTNRRNGHNGHGHHHNGAEMTALVAHLAGSLPAAGLAPPGTPAGGVLDISLAHDGQPIGTLAINTEAFTKFLAMVLRRVVA